MSDGQNKRIVKKSKNKDKMNIKVSTQDKDLSKDNNININLSAQKGKSKQRNSIVGKTNKEGNDNKIENRISKLIEKNKKGEEEIETIKAKIKENNERDISEILSLNKELTTLDKNYNDLSKNNNSLLRKLKGIEKEVAHRFEDKFKISKVIKRQKTLDNHMKIETEIKAKNQQKKNVEKMIKYEQNEIKKMNKYLEDNKNGADQILNDELTETNNKIKELQKEIEKLNKIKEEHSECEKNNNLLKYKLNVLSNDYEFESKKEIMINTEVVKVVPTKIINVNKAMSYGEQVRKDLLTKLKHKYSSKIKIVNYKSYNFLLNEFINNKVKNDKRGSSYKNLQTLENTELPDFSTYLKNDISARIDAKSPQKYLFSPDEKEVLKKLIPNEYYNIYNDKFTKIENQLTEMSEKFREDKKKLKQDIHLDNVKNESKTLKLKEFSQKKVNLEVIISRNNKRIGDLKNKIKKINDEIKKQNMILTHKNRNTKILKNRIEVVQKSKQQQTEELPQ